MEEGAKLEKKKAVPRHPYKSRCNDQSRDTETYPKHYADPDLLRIENADSNLEGHGSLAKLGAPASAWLKNAFEHKISGLPGGIQNGSEEPPLAAGGGVTRHPGAGAAEERNG